MLAVPSGVVLDVSPAAAYQLTVSSMFVPNPELRTTRKT
jgi:hypothetical protein